MSLFEFSQWRAGMRPDSMNWVKDLDIPYKTE
jgi:hypothetical protein